MPDPFRRRRGDEPKLKPLQVPGLPQPIAFRDGKLTVGRAEDNDLTLPGEIFPSVSTHHARFSIDEEGHVWVEDLESRNGTLVGDERIDAPRQLQAGEIVQFGPIGPRFLLMASSNLSETVFIDPALTENKHDTLSATRMQRIKTALGVPEGDVGTLVEKRTRRAQLTALVAVVLVAAAVALWTQHMMRQNDEDMREAEERHQAELAEAVDNMQEKLDLSLAEFVDRERTKELEVEEVRRELEQERERLRADKQSLEERLAKLETDDSTSLETLQAVRDELEEAREQLDLIDPVNLAQERLSDVARVRSSVVLIEVSMYLEHEETGQLLFETFSGEPNFEDRGMPFELPSTGSGFCVSEEGWILTNAHVVLPGESNRILRQLADLPIEPRLELEVVFSDSSVRHEATLEAYANEGDEDLALIRIEPFEGMPHLEDFDLDAPYREPGSDVFLFGFPLGHYALQEGDTVIASTFRGILSRRVAPYIQVDAGVHPGNSGGPVTDAAGNVIGIVVSVQSTPERSAVYTIGYAIPIGDASKVWPPRVLADAGEETAEPAVVPVSSGEGK